MSCAARSFYSLRRELLSVTVWPFFKCYLLSVIHFPPMVPFTFQSPPPLLHALLIFSPFEFYQLTSHSPSITFSPCMRPSFPPRPLLYLLYFLLFISDHPCCCITLCLFYLSPISLHDLTPLLYNFPAFMSLPLPCSTVPLFMYFISFSLSILSFPVTTSMYPSLPSFHSSPKAGEHGIWMQLVWRCGGVAGVVPAGCLLPLCQGPQLGVELHWACSAAGRSGGKVSQLHALCFVSEVGCLQFKDEFKKHLNRSIFLFNLYKQLRKTTVNRNVFPLLWKTLHLGNGSDFFF